MTNKLKNYSAITLIPVILAAILVMPIYIYALYEGAGVNYAAIVYIGGLLVGSIIISVAILIDRRLKHRNNGESGEKNKARTQFQFFKSPKKRALLALGVLVIIVAMFFYCPLFCSGCKSALLPSCLLGRSNSWHYPDLDHCQIGREKIDINF